MFWLVNVVGTALCVSRFGIIGAADVSGIAYLIGPGLIMNWYYSKKIGLEISRFWKSIAKIFIVPILMIVIGLALTHFISFNGWLPLLIAILVYAAIFLALNWLLIMNDYEKDIFRGPIKKIISKFRKKKAV